LSDAYTFADTGTTNTSIANAQADAQSISPYAATDVAIFTTIAIAATTTTCSS
jgi:hypothetical protein